MLFVYILFKLVEILYFDSLKVKYCFFYVGKVLEGYEFLNVMWLNMYYIWTMKIVWNWCHTFGIMYELLFDDIKYEKSMFNRDPLASLMI